MSQIDEVKDLLLKQKKDSEEFKSRLDEMEKKTIAGEDFESHKTAVEQMQKKFDEYGENINKLTKAIEVEKLKTKA
ncbi:MAG: hypothetical protein NE327_04160, partial [Lentisphaeraceae bacterium]|nr:hypothetical protein [Lentisphaeraceae bacterium]